MRVEFIERNDADLIVAQLRAQGSQSVQAFLAIIDNDLEYTVMLSRDPADAEGKPINERGFDYRWHISVAGPDTVPPWADFVAIVHALRPGVMFCVPMPPQSYWMNVNSRVLHVWELHDDALTEGWRATGEHARAAGLGGAS
jgi:hypothetical protein